MLMVSRLAHLLLGIYITSSLLYGSNSPMFFTGAIQFPKELKSVPQIFMCSQGSRIQVIADDTTNKLLYTVRKLRTVQKFSLVITQNLLYDRADQNTIECWRVDPTKPYKFYTLTRSVEEQTTESDSGDNQPKPRWIICAHDLAQSDGRLPDDTVIMYYNPDLITEIRGGGPFEWPTLFVREDAVALAGSSEAFHELSKKLFIAAMDLRSFFCLNDEYIIRKRDTHPKTIVVISVA